MQDNVFFDSNLWVYRFSNSIDVLDVEKKKYIGKFISENDFNIHISNQVLKEFSNILIKKYRVDQNQIIEYIEKIQEISNISLVTIGNIKNALNISSRYQLNFYDSLIISSGIDDECKIIYSEDLQDGQIFTHNDKTIKIENPLKHIRCE